MADADAPTTHEQGGIVVMPSTTGDESPELDEKVALDRVRQRMLGLNEAPSTVGHYRVVGRLGTGGMGVVFDARDDELDRPVAIKILRRELASDVAWRDRFLREAQALARLSHPNVVQVYEVGRHDGQIFIAMERVLGTSLRAWSRAAPRTWQEIVRVFVGAGAGLSAAHRAGLVHRDFKPDNLLIDHEGRARVLDFGIVRFDAEPSGGAGPEATTGPHPSVSAVETQAGVVMGTLAYMAPEQRAGGPIDARADQYAFGVTLYEALHGCRPAQGTGPEDVTLQAARQRSHSDMHMAAVRIDKRVPAWLHEVVLRAFEPAPEDRWPTIDAMLEALQRPPRRRVAVGIGATAAVGVAAVALHFGAQARHASACDDAATTLKTWWTQVRSQAMGGLVRTEVSNAAQTWEALAPRVDDYVAGWTAMHAATCRATRVDHERTEALLAAAHACLDERRAAIETLVEIWSNATDAEVQTAAPAAAALPSLRPCDDPQVLDAAAQDLARVDDQTLRNQRARMFRADASRRAGRVQEALAIAQALLEEVEDPALHAQAQVLVGLFSADNGQIPEAQAAYERAIVEAIAAGRNEVVGEAAAKLVGVVGLAQRRTDDAKWYADVARAALERAGVAQADPRMASMLGNLGSVTAMAGDPAGGLALHQQSLEDNMASLGPEHPDTLTARDNLATDYSLMGRHEEAEQEYVATLAVRERLLGADHPGVATTLDNLGINLGVRGDFAGAIACHERALAMQTAIHGDEHPRVADSLENHASDYLQSGNDEKAVELYTRALAITRKLEGDDTPDVARLLHNRAGALSNLGRSDEALAAAREATAIQERALGPEHPDLSWSLQTLGSILYARGEYDDALPPLERAVVLRQAVMPDSPELALLLTELGRVLAALGRHADALARLSLASVILERGPAQPLILARNRAALARALGETGGDMTRARDLAERARQTYARLGPAEEASELAAWLADHRAP